MATPAGADGGSLPLIEDCGLTTNSPALPHYELRNIHLSKTRGDSNGGYDSEIRMAMPGHGELLLSTYFYEDSPESELDRERKINWDHVAGRKVALGWLQGDANLLLVSWTDLSASHGTGHYVTQWYLLARVGHGTSSVLLKKSVCSEGRERDISEAYGRGMHYFAYDPSRQELVDTMKFARTLYVGPGYNIPPLFYEVKAEPPENAGQYVADIQETVVHRYRLRAKSVKSLEVELFYRTQPLDTPRDIARFYFGPLAPASVVLKATPKFPPANPGAPVDQLRADWKGRFGKDPGYAGGWFRLPVGTLVRIPLPEDWITKFYEQP